MPKKSKIEYINKKTIEYLNNTIENKLETYKEISANDLFIQSKNDHNLNKYKAPHKLGIYLESGNNNNLIMLLASDYPSEEKDTIKVSEKLVECIGTLEKTFIFLDEVEITRKSEKNKHYILVKIVKNDYSEFLNQLETTEEIL